MFKLIQNSNCKSLKQETVCYIGWKWVIYTSNDKDFKNLIKLNSSYI